jgi:hypothetical protein
MVGVVVNRLTVAGGCVSVAADRDILERVVAALDSNPPLFSFGSVANSRFKASIKSSASFFSSIVGLFGFDLEVNFEFPSLVGIGGPLSLGVRLFLWILLAGVYHEDEFAIGLPCDGKTQSNG